MPMVLSSIKKLFKKKEKRQNWFPFSVTTGSTELVYSPSSLPAVRRAISLYHNLLVATPIDCEGEKPLWLNKPCSYMSRSNWLKRLVEDYFVQGNFYCFKQYDNAGNLIALPPFQSGSIFQYAKTKDSSNPLELQQENSRYYLSQYEREGNQHETRFLPEDIFHFMRADASPPDQLNGLTLSALCPETISLAISVLNAAEKFASTNFIAPQAVGGISEMDAETRAALRNHLNGFLRDGGTFLTLDDAISFKELIQSNVGSLISIISSLAATSVARIFSCPSSLIEREDAATTDGGQALKESHRHWLKNSGRAFLEIVGEEFSHLAGKEIKFLWRAHQVADLRETGVIPQLIQDNLITKERAQEWLK